MLNPPEFRKAFRIIQNVLWLFICAILVIHNKAKVEAKLVIDFNKL